MPQQSYNFFGLGPGQLAPSQDPALLAQQMALQEYNNPTSSQTASSSGNSSGTNPQALARMMMTNQGGSGVPPEAIAQGIPANAQSYNLGAGPLPWLPQNALPWSGGNG